MRMNALRSPSWKRRVHKKIDARVEELARTSDTSTYGKLGALVGLTARDPFLRDTLVDITRREDQEGRPLLPVLIVKKGLGRPGHGFFRLAEKLGRYQPGPDSAHSERQFYKEELERVWGYWQPGGSR